MAKLLIIEYNQKLSETIHKAAQEAGWDTATAKNKEEAKIAIGLEKFAVMMVGPSLLSDFKAEGLPLIKWIRGGEESNRTRIIGVVPEELSGTPEHEQIQWRLNGTVELHGDKKQVLVEALSNVKRDLVPPYRSSQQVKEELLTMVEGLKEITERYPGVLTADHQKEVLEAVAKALGAEVSMQVKGQQASARARA